MRFLAALALAPPVAAQLAALPFLDCAQPDAPPARIRVDAVYAQLAAAALNLTLLARAGATLQDRDNTSNILSTVFAPTSVLTFVLNPDDHSRFCATVRPPDPLPPLQAATYCPLAPGPFAFAVGTPLARAYELVTLNTRIRVVDTSTPAQELACIQLAVTPVHPGFAGSVYGHVVLVFWLSVALAAAYWLLVGAARLAAASKRGRQRVHNNLWSHIQGAGFVLASAISGERFAASPALIRFATPSMRDVVFHTQWCALLAMVTVQWPQFTYPYLAQTAWSTLLYNVSLTQHAPRWDPLHTEPFQPPAGFADQLADPTSPLFLNTSIPNTIFSFPPGIPTVGIPALAATVGVRAQDVFNNALALFLLILGATIVLSVVIGATDWLLGSLVRASRKAGTSGTRTPPWTSATSKHFDEPPDATAGDEDVGTGTVRFLHRPASRTLPAPKGWLSHRLGQTSFHGSVLHGNLVRILILFHLPVTIFSCYQFSSGKSHSSLVSVILAALAFAVFSIAIPAWLVFRLTTTATSKLYDETRTLLSLGPLYNHYSHGSQLFACLFFASNIAYGVVIGCGQASGTAQSIIILVVEVASALTTSVWLPWARGATMGGISFMLCVARIITAVLLVILSPVVSVGDAAGGWIAYTILLIQGLVYLAFLLLLVCKLGEGAVRFFGDVSFDRSKHTADTGLIGAIGLAGCCGARRKRRRRSRARAASDGTAQSMLPPAAAAASRSRTSVSGPTSVLRPEQLNQPYREDSDDEGGYILGAWHDEDEQAPEPPPPPPPTTTTTGFSRVAGGRANIESPYTIEAGTSASVDSTRPPSPAAGGAGLYLPPGAVAPGAQPARRGWLDALLRRREGGRSASDVPMLADEPARTFVVIRERRPSPLSQAHAPGGEDPAGSTRASE